MVKPALQRLLSSRWVAPAWSPLMNERVAVLTLHRFAMPDLGIGGHDPAVLARALERLRREGYALLGLDEAVRRLRERSGMPGRAVVFTVDDGYFDFGAAAAEVFLAYDCPVTVFLTTGFIDGSGWHWWDQITHVLTHARSTVIELPLDGETLRLDLRGPATRPQVAEQVGERCKRVADEAKWRFIEALSAAAEVEIPRRAPAEFGPLSWDDARALERRGVSFGPHTISHPILIRTTDAEAEREIRVSWERVRRELARPVPVFSYPNGDFGAREMALVERLGLEAGLTMSHTYASADVFHAGPDGPYRLGRFPYPEHPDQLCLTASGFMRIAMGVRRTLRPAVSP